MNIFDENGYLDVRAIVRACPEAVFFWIIGARRTGKTYTTLDMIHEEQRPYIFMRMTAEEMKMTCTSKINMYVENGFPWADDMSIGDGSPTYIYDKKYKEGKVPAGMALPLSGVAKIRGYGAKRYTDIVFDEFIPEETVRVQFDAGTALKNAYMTINGNREREGLPPVRVFLLANSNDIRSKILASFNMTSRVLMMMQKHQNFSYMPERRSCIVLVGADSPVAQDMQRSALMQCIGTEDEFTRMAISNVFANDDDTGVGSRPVKEYNCVFRLDDFSFLKHKRRNEWYIVKGGPKSGYKGPYSGTYHSKNPTSLKALRRAWAYLGPITPIDGVNLFYNCYEAKLAMYNYLRLDK